MYNAEDLQEFCVQVFKPHSEMFHTWNEIARNLLPEYATFYSDYYQNGYAPGLATSAPITMFRDLADSVGTVLRYGDWFDNTVSGVKEDDESFDWLQKSTILMRQQLSPQSGFNRTSKIHDRAYLLWGNAPKSVTLNKDRSGLLFQAHRLKDVAWTEDYAGEVEAVVRKWCPTYNQAYKLFPEGKLCSEFIKSATSKSDKFNNADLRHIVMPTWMYGDSTINEDEYAYVAIWLDHENGHVIEIVPMKYNQYVISRHFPIANSPFSFSPIASTALIDSRSMQIMTNTLMDAAERYVRPPIIATRKAIVGKLDLTGRSATWVDQNYDERAGDPLRTLDMGGAGAYPVGSDVIDRMKHQLGEDLYKEKLTLPEPTDTASEWNDRMEAYRLGVYPILQPLIDEDSAKTCDLVFDIMMNNNMFGSPEDIPEALQGKEVDFEFKSPLTQTEDQKVISKYLTSLETIANTMNIYPDVAVNFEPNTALRDVLQQGQDVPAHWIKSEEEVEESLAKQEQEQELMKAAGMAQELGAAGQALQQ